MGFNIGNIVNKAKSGLKKIDNAIMKPPSPEELAHRKRVKETYESERREAEVKNARKRAQIDADAEIKNYRKSKTGQKKGDGPSFSNLGKSNPIGDFGGNVSNPFGDMGLSSPRIGKGNGRKGKQGDPFKGLM